MADVNAKHLMCRGKSELGWVEGYFLPQMPDVMDGAPMIYVFGDGECTGFCVEPETVTTCSGMPSKTGKLIFDQDIVIDRAQKVAGLVEYSEEDGSYAIVTKDGKVYRFDETPSTDFYIVGNSIDNPDYLDFV